MAGNDKKRLLIIGPAPYDMGGVSIHIRRLSYVIKDNFTINYINEGRNHYNDIFSLRSLNVFQYLKLVLNADIIHIHSGSVLLRLFHIFVCRIILRRKTVLTIHRDVTIEKYLWLTKSLVDKCQHVITVNSKSYDILYRKSKCKYHLMPAFLPPIIETEEELPSDVTNWLYKCRQIKDSVIMVSNAWNLILHNNCDLYGLDMCIELIKKLIDNNKTNYYLLFVLATNTNQKQLQEEYERFISENGLNDNILIWNSGLSFVKLIQESDIVLRTTNTDGDALSIREALYYGVNVIASDVVSRPEGTTLFKTRDLDDLYRAVIDNSTKEFKKQNEVGCINEYKEKYLEIYK